MPLACGGIYMRSRPAVQNNQSARDKVVAAINAEASYAETYCAKLPAGCPVTFVAASAVAFSPTPAATSSTVRTPSERELPPAVTHRATRGRLPGVQRTAAVPASPARVILLGTSAFPRALL